MTTLLRAAWLAITNLKRRWQGVIAGCVLWLMWMIFGFWSTLLLLVLGVVGFFIGRILEDRRDFRTVIEKLLSDRYHDS